MKNFEKELKVALEVVKEAGMAILHVREQNESLGTVIKEGIHPSKGSSPVTVADFKSNEIIIERLMAEFPSHALLSEELLEEHVEQEWWKAEFVWYIDPLGGTKNFIKGLDDFGIYLGLAKKGVPVVGVYHFPAKNLTYWATKDGGAFKQSCFNKPVKLDRSSVGDESILPLKIPGEKLSKPFYEKMLGKKLLDDELESRILKIGCFGQTLCAIAEGGYNLFLFDGSRGGLWDLIPGEVILREMGCVVTDYKGNPIDYLRKDATITGGVLASGNDFIHAKALVALNQLTR